MKTYPTEWQVCLAGAAFVLYREIAFRKGEFLNHPDGTRVEFDNRADATKAITEGIDNPRMITVDAVTLDEVKSERADAPPCPPESKWTARDAIAKANHAAELAELPTYSQLAHALIYLTSQASESDLPETNRALQNAASVIAKLAGKLV